MSDHVSEHKNFEVITAAPTRLGVSPGRSYRRWSKEAKARIVEETLAPGANVSAIARAHGIDASQLFVWRRKALAPGLIAAGEAGRSVKFAQFEAMASDLVEIVIGDAVVRVGSDVAAERLATVIRAVRQA
jgi:transposase